MDQLSDPATFADHLRPFVLNYPQPEKRSGEETSFLVTLFSGGDGNGWAFLLRPSEEEPQASGRSSRGAARRWGLTVDAGRVVDVTPAGEDDPFCVVPLPSARATEPDHTVTPPP